LLTLVVMTPRQVSKTILHIQLKELKVELVLISTKTKLTQGKLLAWKFLTLRHTKLITLHSSLTVQLKR
jgi:hypothetical protein